MVAEVLMLGGTPGKEGSRRQVGSSRAEEGLLPGGLPGE